MPSGHIKLNVTYRDISVYSSAVLRDADGSGGFLETDSPMPVGTMLVLSPMADPGLQVAARVGLVVEACQGGQPAVETPGMSVVFEAAGGRLLDHQHEDGAGMATELTPAPIGPSPKSTLAGFVSPSVSERAPAPVIAHEPKVIIDEPLLEEALPTVTSISVEPPAAAEPAAEEGDSREEAEGDEGEEARGEETDEVKSEETDDGKKKKRGRRAGRRKKR